MIRSIQNDSSVIRQNQGTINVSAEADDKVHERECIPSK